MTKVSFTTLGCRANQAETAVLEDVFRRKGFELVRAGVPADIAVINSCTVTAESDHEVRRVIKRLCDLNPGVRIAVIGCQAQVQQEKVLEFPNVCWAVGTARKMQVADIILDSSKSRRLVVVPISRKPFTMPLAEFKGRRTRANLKIQDGCDNFCAYCEIPYARGRARSRVFGDVLAAGEALVRAGHQEVVLTGINLGLYAHEGRKLVDLVRGLEKIEGLRRIRLSSLEYAPGIMELAKLMQPGHKLCRFLHMPVQSGSDRILQRMGRRYTSAQAGAMFRAFARKVPGILAGTDVIAGFPGETEKDFEDTCRFLSEEPVSYFHVFSYSDRQKARSRTFKGALPAAVVRERARRLRALGRLKYGRFLDSLAGQSAEVLFEHKKDDDWFGHTDNYVTIKTRSTGDLHNRIIPVRIRGIEGDKAIGEI